MIHFPQIEKAQPFTRWVWSTLFFYSFANATASAGPALQLTLLGILCAAPRQSCRARVHSCNDLAHSTRGFPHCQPASPVQTCISCKFLKWFSYISPQTCIVSAPAFQMVYNTIQYRLTELLDGHCQKQWASLEVEKIEKKIDKFSSARLKPEL